MKSALSAVTIALITTINVLFALTIHRDSLTNGLVILICEDQRLPMVDISFNCRSGAVCEPEGKAGVASLCADMLLRGTRNLSADSLANILDFIGAQYFSGADFDRSYLYLRILPKDLTTGFDILTEVIRQPSFPEDEFTRAREQLLFSLRRSYDYPSFVVSAEFDRILFKGHRYALPLRGDTSTIPEISREDLITFHKNHFVPNNCFIVVVGAVNPTDVYSIIKEKFADWQPAPINLPPPPDFNLPEKTRVKLIPRPDMNQTYVYFGHPGIAASAEDLIPTRLMSYILGGPPLSSRMGLAVREYGGLAYDVRCWFDRRILTGAFRATVQTAKPHEAIEKMFTEIRKIYQSGVKPKELLAAQNYFTGSFPLSYSSNRGKVDRIAELEIYRFGTDWLEIFPKNVRSTTLEQVNESARKRLFPDRYIMIIMGNVAQEQLPLPDVEWLE